MGYLDEIKSFILDWNLNNPVDHWWRTKYNVPFGSPAHLDMDLIDMRVSFEEEQMFLRIRKELSNRRDEEENAALGIGGDTVKKIVPMSDKQIDEEFENLDLSKFSDKKETNL